MQTEVPQYNRKLTTQVSSYNNTMSCQLCGRTLWNPVAEYCYRCFNARQKILNGEYYYFDLSTKKVILCYQLPTGIIKVKRPLLAALVRELDNGILSAKAAFYYLELPSDPQITHVWIDRVEG